MVLKIPLVLESDYPAFKSICCEEVVGHDYKEYLMRIINRRASLREIGMDVELFKISAQPLLAHLGGHGALRYLHRPANLEDVFLKLTGREMRE